MRPPYRESLKVRFIASWAEAVETVRKVKTSAKTVIFLSFSIFMALYQDLRLYVPTKIIVKEMLIFVKSLSHHTEK